MEKEKLNKILKEQLNLALHGNFDEAEQVGLNGLKEELTEPHLLFNAGWYEIRKGNLLYGHKLLDYGRVLNCFGNEVQQDLPFNKNINNQHVLLYLEGGFGDQIINVRFAKDIAKLGNKVIACCDPALMTIIKDLEGVSAVVNRDGVYTTYFDSVVPSASAVVNLEYEYKDLCGKPYIKQTLPKTDKFRIGVKWSGNPKFEHEQHRKWDIKYLLDVIEPLKDKVEFVSLQRDEEKDLAPDYVKRVNLDTWEDTRDIISTCDMVISSCTSVAHLAGAMGIDTRVIVPVLSYYIWALPQDTSPYYDSVKIYRQEVYGDWAAPFNKLREDLNNVCK